jgi:hypothetical protein
MTNLLLSIRHFILWSAIKHGVDPSKVVVSVDRDVFKEIFLDVSKTTARECSVIDDEYLSMPLDGATIVSADTRLRPRESECKIVYFG